eukprot:gene9696-13050_t
MEYNVCIVGAGLAGTSLAALLAKAGFAVHVYEKRTDPRLVVEASGDAISSEFGTSTSSTKRSINLALSYRGMVTLQEIGILDEVMKTAIRMPCRIIHNINNNINNNNKEVKQAYGKEDQALWSVGRQSINAILLDLVESHRRCHVHFGHSFVNASKDGTCIFTTFTGGKLTKTFDIIIGADGAYSSVRECMLKQSRINFSRDYIQHGYKELTIPPVVKEVELSDGTIGKEDSYALVDPNGLHIWPRGEFMLIALPNPDKSFTATLFAPYHGQYGFDAVDAEDSTAVINYFNLHFPDVVPLMPDIVNDFRNNPVGSLVSIRMNPFNYGKMILIGDAAHAVVPFFGQGMNAAFEDSLILFEMITSEMIKPESRLNGLIDFSKVLSNFTEYRMPAVHALAEMCLEHYHDMAKSTASSFYLLTKKLHSLINWCFPQNFIPLYSMVAFSNIPYHEALRKSIRQDRILNRLLIVGSGLIGFGVISTIRQNWKSLKFY